MDDKDRELLGWLRKGVPLIPRPFEALAAKTGLDAAEVLLRVLRLNEEGAVSPLRAVLDARQFAYQNVWAAAELEEDDLLFEAAAARINAHPGVARSHRRFHRFNFWFTLMLPPSENAEEHIALLLENSGARSMVLMPAQKSFCAGVETEAPKRNLTDFEADELKVLRVLQDDLPMADAPFLRLASSIGMKESLFLEAAQDLLKRGVLKRIAAQFPAELMPQPPQSMAVWQVPEEKQASVAREMSLVSGVTRTAVRRAHPAFPYSLYMFFASAPEDEERIISETESRVGKWPRLNVPVVREYKTDRPKYFPNLETWTRQNQPALERGDA